MCSYDHYVMIRLQLGPWAPVQNTADYPKANFAVHKLFRRFMNRFAHIGQARSVSIREP